MSKKRFLCWQCGQPMKARALACKRCKRTRPRSVKATTAMLAKSYGGNLRPVPVAKAARPECPNCGAKGARTANCCTRCGAPITPLGVARAEKSARARLQIAGTPDYFLARAAREHDPDAREQWRAAARKAAAGQQAAAAASVIVKASGASTIREAWLAQSDPHMREVLRAALYDNGRGRPA